MSEEQPNPSESIWTRALIVLLQILVPGVVLLLGLFLTKPRDNWEIAGLAVSVAIVASTAITLLLSHHYLRRAEAFVSAMDASLSERLDSIGHMALIRAEGARAGWTQDRLSDFESRIEVRTIWIAGSDFSTEMDADAPFLDVVRKNIYDRGIRYVYIAPENPALNRMFDRLRHELNLKRDDPRLLTVTLDQQKWEQMPYTAGNFTIYDPVRTGRSPEGFCWDPGGDGESFIKLRHNVAEWVGRVQDLCPELDSESQWGTNGASGRSGNHQGVRFRRLRILRPRRSRASTNSK